MISKPIPEYVDVVFQSVRELELELTRLYNGNWYLKLERKGPEMWCCEWGVFDPTIEKVAFTEHFIIKA